MTAHESARLIEVAIAESVPRSGTLREMMSRYAQACVDYLGAAFARIWTLDETGMTLELQASAGMYTHLDGGHARVQVGAFKIGRIAEERLPHLTNDVLGDPRVGDREWARREGLVSFAGYPLLHEGRLFGVIGMFGRAALPKPTLEALSTVADRIAATLDGRSPIAAPRATAHTAQPPPPASTIDQSTDARFRFLADAIPHQVWTARPDGQIDYVNKRVLDYFGRSHEKILGRGWVDMLHPDDVAACIERWTASLKSGDPYEFEFRLWSVQERRFLWHVAVALPRRDETGEITHWFGTNTDIDSRRRIEDAQRIVIDAGRKLSASLDYDKTLAALADVCIPTIADWCIIDVVTPGEGLERARVAHANSVHAALAERLMKFPGGIHPNHPSTGILRGGEALLIEEVTSTQLDSFAVGPEHRAALAELGPCSVISAPLLANDRVVGVLTLVTTAESGRRLGALDLGLTEELARRAALALQNARHYNEARLANEELDQFAYVASHDLKAPLRGIANLSQWLEEGLGDKLDDEGREQMRLLRGRVSRLEGLIDGILDYARAGRNRVKTERVDVGELIAEVVELLAAPEAVRISVGAMPIFFTERVPLQQVFMNLIGNAQKHADRADARITISCRNLGSAYDFAIADNGPGIAPEYQERIWNLFQTLEARDKKESTGIGLSVVKKIVETRGGRVSVESRLGEGATFHVQWPKRAEERP